MALVRDDGVLFLENDFAWRGVDGQRCIFLYGGALNDATSSVANKGEACKMVFVQKASLDVKFGAVNKDSAVPAKHLFQKKKTLRKTTQQILH